MPEMTDKVQTVSFSLLPPHPCQFILAFLARLG
jgi:hypothetical protein